MSSDFDSVVVVGVPPGGVTVVVVVLVVLVVLFVLFVVLVVVLDVVCVPSGAVIVFVLVDWVSVLPEQATQTVCPLIVPGH